jgi:hypothetical protein
MVDCDAALREREQRGVMDEARCGVASPMHGAARIESDIGVILTISVAIFV